MQELNLKNFIRQFMINITLVKNAIKFTDHGKIEIGYELIENYTVDQQHARYLQFYVKDTGIGIAKEKHDKVFDRFVQVNNQLSGSYEGSGLGLAITKAYTMMLGGRIWLESEPGKYTEFYFTLPYITEKQDIVTEKAEKLAPDVKEIKSLNKKLKILIAEDDETSIDLLGKILKYIPSDLIFTRNSKETIDCFFNSKDIDLILLDIRMPGIDGYSIAREIRKVDKKIVIIAQTAYALENDREKTISAGCNDYIPKPLFKSDLLNLIGKYFDI